MKRSRTSSPSARRKPVYRRQKRKDRDDLAYVTLGGKRRYLGPYGSGESMEAYAKLLAEWKAGRQDVADHGGRLTVVELCRAFLRHAAGYYSNADGTRSKEYENHLGVVKILRSICGRMPADEFGPRELKAVRQEMVDKGWVRQSINRNVGRLRRMFKWAASEELIPASVCQSLATVAGLRASRCAAPEREVIAPVGLHEVKAILPHVTPVLREMIRLQWLTGMRPGELVIMRPTDIDTSGKTWIYRPYKHKTQLRGRQRLVPLGPKARKLINRYRHNREPDAFCFSPAESEAMRRKEINRRRKSSPSCGNRPGTNRKQRPARKAGLRYTTQSYGRAIAYGCEATWPHPTLSKIKPGQLTDVQKQELREWNRDHRWCPNQVRHATATRIRKIAGLEMARIILGHSTMAVTETYYAEADMKKASRLMSKIG